MASELSFLKLIWAMGSMTIPRRMLMGEPAEGAKRGAKGGAPGLVGQENPRVLGAYRLDQERVLKSPDDRGAARQSYGLGHTLLYKIKQRLTETMVGQTWNSIPRV